MSGALHSLLAKLTESKSAAAPAANGFAKSATSCAVEAEIASAALRCSIPSDTIAATAGGDRHMDADGSASLRHTAPESKVADPDSEEMQTEKDAENEEESVAPSAEEAVEANGANEYIGIFPRPISEEKIFLQANFYSYAEFDRVFEEWKRLYKHPFRVASSEKLEDPEKLAKFRYRYVVYHCSRYGEPRKRVRTAHFAGQGRRPHQNYLPCGCQAKLRLNYHPQTNGGALCVTTLLTDHNHEPIADGLESCSVKRRKSSPEEGFESGTASREHSPNSTASSGAFFSPLSLHHPLSLMPQLLLHNSPSSSGGQSSSEGMDTLLAAMGEHNNRDEQRKASLQPSPFMNKGMVVKNEYNSDIAGAPNVDLKHNPFATPSFAQMGSNSSHTLLAALRSAMANNMGEQRAANGVMPLPNAAVLADLMQQRHQQRNTTPNEQMLPIIQELLRNEQRQQQQNAPARMPQQHNTLSAMLSHQMARMGATAIKNESANTPALFDTLHALSLEHQQRDNTVNGVSTSAGCSSSAPSLVSLLQHAQLLNAIQQQSNRLAGTNHNASAVLQQMLTGQQRDRTMTEQKPPHRTEIIREADWMLQAIVSQMIHAKDLNAYLAHLRQFIAERASSFE